MDEFKFNSKGKDAKYLTNATMFLTALFTLGIFRNGWPEEKLGSLSVLQKSLDWFREMFQGGLLGNRIHIAARRVARAELNMRIRKILLYISIMADEDDITILLNSGVVTRITRKGSRKTVKLAPAN